MEGPARSERDGRAGATMVKTDRVKANLLCDVRVKQARRGR
jgi:hypothetical protein